MSRTLAGQAPEVGVWPALLWLFFFFVLLGPAWPEAVWILLLWLAGGVFFVVAMLVPEGQRLSDKGWPRVLVAGAAFFLLMTEGEAGTWWVALATLLALAFWHWERRGGRKGGVSVSARALQCAVAIGVCLLAWSSRNVLRDDWAYLRARVAHGPAKGMLRRPDDAALAVLEVGSIVQFEGAGRCRPRRLPTVVAFDCRTLHWSELPVSLADPVPPGWALAIDTNRIMRDIGVADPSQDTRFAWREVKDLWALWWPLSRACTQGPATLEGFAERCEQTKRDVAAALLLSQHHGGRNTLPVADWEAALRQGSLRYRSVYVADSGEALRGALSGLQSWVAHERARTLAHTFALPERGSSLRLGSDEAQRWPRSFRIRTQATLAAWHPDDLLPLAAVDRLAAQASGEAFSLSGVITARHVDEQGHLTLTVNARRGPLDHVAVLERLAACLAAVLLLCRQGGELVALRMRTRLSR